MTNYEPVVLNETLVLLDRVERIMHTRQLSLYPTLTLAETFSCLLKLWQMEKVYMLVYLERFKSERSIVLNLFGNHIFDGFVKKTQQKNCLSLGWCKGEVWLKWEAIEKFWAVLFIRGSDQGQ